MKLVITSLLLATVFAVPVALQGSTETTAPQTAVCPVCRLNGETEPEAVKATRTWNGTTYGFCSDKCAKTFDADPAAYVLTELPYPAPALAARSLDGKPVKLDSYAGQVVLVDFWATWCAPCLKSMPELQKLHERYGAKGVVILGVSVDEDPKKVTKFLKGRKFTYPIALDAGEPAAFQSWGVRAVPAAFLVDREGRVVARWLGRTDPKAVEDEIRLLLEAGS